MKGTSGSIQITIEKHHGERPPVGSSLQARGQRSHAVRAMQRRYQAGRKEGERVGVVKEAIEKVQAHSQAGPLKGSQFDAPQPVLKMFSFLKVDRHLQNCSIKIVAAAGGC